MANNFEKTGEARSAHHQKSAPQEKPLPSSVTSPRPPHTPIKHPRIHNKFPVADTDG